MKVTVYSNPGCYRCRATTRHMDNLGISYDLVMLVDNPHEADRLRSEGKTELPVVEVTSPSGIRSWTGFRPSLVAGLLP